MYYVTLVHYSVYIIPVVSRSLCFLLEILTTKNLRLFFGNQLIAYAKIRVGQYYDIIVYRDIKVS